MGKITSAVELCTKLRLTCYFQNVCNNNFTMYMYFYKDDDAIMWRWYTIMMSVCDSVLSDCLTSALTGILTRLEKFTSTVVQIIEQLFHLILIYMKIE